MSVRRHGAALEEQAELHQLRDQADQTAAEAARTLEELTGRLAAMGHPGAMARRLAADARAAAARTLRELPRKIASQRGAWGPALAAIPVLAVAVAVAVARQRARPQSTAEIKFATTERVRPHLARKFPPKSR